MILVNNLHHLQDLCFIRNGHNAMTADCYRQEVGKPYIPIPVSLAAVSLQSRCCRSNKTCLFAGFHGLQALAVSSPLRYAPRLDPQCKDLQLNIVETLDAMSQRIMHSLRSYPGTPSTFIDTWDSVEEGIRLHVTLKNKNNDDSVEFSGVGGDSKAQRLGRYLQPVVHPPLTRHLMLKWFVFVL